MKSKEELNALKEEVETVNCKVRELSDEELEMVVGGCVDDWEKIVREISSFRAVNDNEEGLGELSGLGA